MARSGSSCYDDNVAKRGASKTRVTQKTLCHCKSGIENVQVAVLPAHFFWQVWSFAVEPGQLHATAQSSMAGAFPSKPFTLTRPFQFECLYLAPF